MARTGVSVEIVAFGDVQISRKLLRWSENARNTFMLWPILKKDLMMIEKVQFLTEGAHGGGAKWAQLADATVKQKENLGQPPWIERATEALFKSLTESSAPSQIYEASTTFMRFGSRTPYGSFSQKGTINMPQRKIIDLRESERRLLMKSVQRFIVHGDVLSIAEL